MTLWDIHNHERLLTLAALAGEVTPVAFSPDGNVLAGQSSVGVADGSIHIWRAPSWAEIAAAEVLAAPKP